MRIEDKRGYGGAGKDGSYELEVLWHLMGALLLLHSDMGRCLTRVQGGDRRKVCQRPYQHTNASGCVHPQCHYNKVIAAYRHTPLRPGGHPSSWHNYSRQQQGTSYVTLSIPSPSSPRTFWTSSSVRSSMRGARARILVISKISSERARSPKNRVRASRTGRRVETGSAE